MLDIFRGFIDLFSYAYTYFGELCHTFLTVNMHDFVYNLEPEWASNVFLGFMSIIPEPIYTLVFEAVPMYAFVLGFSFVIVAAVSVLRSWL